MNLTDLQVELRKIEEQLSSLETEIDKMKPKKKEEFQIPYREIVRLAKQYPIYNKKLTKESRIVQKEYVCALAYISLLEESNLNEKLLYISRIALGVELDMTLEDIHRAGVEYNKEDLDQACMDMKQCSYSFVIDALILANIAGETQENMYSAIADIANFLECTKEEMCGMSYVAKAVLLQNYDILEHPPVPSNQYAGKFTSHIPEEWLVAHRKKCKGISLRNKILFQAEEGSVVQEGELLTQYKPYDLWRRNIGRTFQNETIYSIRALSEGIFLSSEYETQEEGIMQEYCDYFVISYFDDLIEFFEWHYSQE